MSAVENLPGTLEQFRKNLNEVYNKDNPLIGARESQLQGYLTAGDKARAQYLPQNSGGTVFSPTELQAMVSGRQAAALAPLSSLNQLIMGQYGGLRDYVGVGRDILTAQSQAAQQRAQDLMNLYQQAAAAKQQEFENQLALQKLKGTGGGVTGVGITGIGKPTFKPTINAGGGIGNQPYGPFLPTQPQVDTAATSMAAVPNLANQPNFFSKWWNRIFPQPEPINTYGTQLNIQ